MAKACNCISTETSICLKPCLPSLCIQLGDVDQVMGIEAREGLGPRCPLCWHLTLRASIGLGYPTFWNKDMFSLDAFPFDYQQYGWRKSVAPPMGVL